MYAEYVEVAPGKPQTGRVKLRISPVTGEAKFSLGEGKKSTGSGFAGSVTEGCTWLGASVNGYALVKNSLH